MQRFTLPLRSRLATTAYRELHGEGPCAIGQAWQDAADFM